MKFVDNRKFPLNFQKYFIVCVETYKVVTASNYNKPKLQHKSYSINHFLLKLWYKKNIKEYSVTSNFNLINQFIKLKSKYLKKKVEKTKYKDVKCHNQFRK